MTQHDRVDLTVFIYSGVFGALMHWSQEGRRTMASKHLYLPTLLGQAANFLHTHPTFQL